MLDIKSHPKVSICIPAYKQTKFLAQTLDSIYLQDFKDYEIIVTDDSPDDSVETLIRSYDFGDKLKYIKNKVQKGSPANWNEAIKHSNGEYIKIMHHDDWFTNDKSLQEFVSLLDNNPLADFAFSGCYNYIGERKNHHFVEYKNIEKLKTDPYILLLGNIIGAPSVTIHRRSVLSRYDESLKWLVDLDFYIQLIKQNQNFGFSIEPLVSICSMGDHQVTNECVHNRNIEIPEYVYVYQKLLNHQSTLNKEQKENILNLFFKYRITKISELENLPLKSKIPKEIKTLFGLGLKIRMGIKLFRYSISHSTFSRQLKRIIKSFIIPVK